MGQGLCRLFARLAGLTCIVATKSGKVVLLQAKPSPAWVRGWIPRLLRVAGHLKAGEEVATMSLSGSLVALFPAREAPALRAEFQPGSFARFQARSRREATDFAFLRTCAEN